MLACTSLLPSLVSAQLEPGSPTGPTTQETDVAEVDPRVERALTNALDGVRPNGTAPRVANTTNLQFDGIPSDRLLAALDLRGIEAAAGPACSAATPQPSPTLLAMGRSRQDALSAVRFSLSRFTTREEIDRTVAATIEAVETLRRR